ncbi:hypothetical protein SAMN06295974_3749 [Plantibacter flavus]|uniref:Uncharacterized protein n=1 Tax=Plantibacter flavus TaxID=150123 RepID=A0A3N2BLF1_9MICO|nr:hypothetical protein [Plantibacter flavus]ROR76103.1 hypothetical protein EDD42_4056 [Plantibacter flavus]SMG48531.1 hypothetical protein SAMN06295974_3749 [Plantibacter flavus]
MITVTHSGLPMPTPKEVRDLTIFLAANADVADADGDHVKAERFREMRLTVAGLAERAIDTSSVTRVVVVHHEPPGDHRIDLASTGRVYDRSELFRNGCAIVLQDAGRTLKLLPAPTAAMPLSA